MPSLEIDPRVLGQRISEARKAQGKTQAEAAELLGYSRPTYIAIEKGHRPASPDEIIKLAWFVGRKVNELVRPGKPVTDLQPHLRAVADRLQGADQGCLNTAIDQFQALAEDYRELERIMNAPLRLNDLPEVAANPKIDPIELAEVASELERKRLGLGDQPVIRDALKSSLNLAGKASKLIPFPIPKSRS
jgi:DNA-binding XRE family transcriptional regulator